MPPTVQTSNRHDSRGRTSTDKRHVRLIGPPVTGWPIRPMCSELVCRVKYNNTLPDIPFDPKFITYPFDSNRYVQYNQTTLERSFKFDLLTEHDLGVPIDLINPDTYQDLNVHLDSEDEHLLDDEVTAQTDAKRSRHHNKSVSWLRKTEYISTEYNRFTQSAQKSEARLGYNIKKQMKEDVLYKDRDSQIKAIGETFELVKKPMWKHPCAQVIFDSDPAQKGKSTQVQLDEMSQAMIRGMVDESGDQFVAYFLPTQETLEKRNFETDGALDSDSEEFEYVLAREYNWNVKNKASRGYEENYFFVMKDDGVYYNELETRVRLSKRRKIGPGNTTVAKSRLIVRHRPLTDQEIAAQDGRVMMLEPPGEEDEMDLIQHGAEDDRRAGSPGSNDDKGSDKVSVNSHSGDERESNHGGGGSDDEDEKASKRSHSDDEDNDRGSKRSHSDDDDNDKASKRSRSGDEDDDKGSRRSRSRSRSGSRSASPSRSRSRSRSKSGSRSGSGSEPENENAIFGSDDSD